MLSFFDFYPPGRRIMSSIFTICFSIWHTRLLWIMFGWWTGHCSNKATRNPGTRKTPAFNMAAGSRSNVHGWEDIQRTRQMRQKPHPFNRTKQFLWGWFNTISSWLVVHCCGSLCGLYSASWETVLNLLRQAAVMLKRRPYRLQTVQIVQTVHTECYFFTLP